MKKLVYPLLAVVIALALQLPLAGQTPVAAGPDGLVGDYFGQLRAYRYRVERQAFIFESLGGETLIEHNADQLSDPASVIKAATTLVALAKLGPDYRFETKFYTNGVLNAETRTIKGDLIILGGSDPSFYYQNAFFVTAALNARGISRVEGDLIVSDYFYFNFNPYPLPSAERLKAALDFNLWDAATMRAWEEYRNQVAGAEGLSVSESPAGVEVTGGVRLGLAATISAGAELLFTHQSNPLRHILKE